VCLSKECTETSCRNASLDEMCVDSRLFECVDGLAVIDTIVVKISLHFSNSGTKNEYLPCAHLLCKAGSASLYYNGQMNTVFVSRLSRNIFPTGHQLSHPLLYMTSHIITKNSAKSHKTCSQVGCSASVLVHNS
jgi:hypothetical protein